jgi:hypothetical protein
MKSSEKCQDRCPPNSHSCSTTTYVLELKPCSFQAPPMAVQLYRDAQSVAQDTSL